jgi:hypothetical protein
VSSSSLSLPVDLSLSRRLSLRFVDQTKLKLFIVTEAFRFLPPRLGHSIVFRNVCNKFTISNLKRNITKNVFSLILRRVDGSVANYVA